MNVYLRDVVRLLHASLSTCYAPVNLATFLLIRAQGQIKKKRDAR